MSARIVVLDIERQSGLADGIWQLKQQGWLQPSQIIERPRTICFAWKWLGEDESHFSAEWEDGHLAMMQKAHAVLEEATHLVGWNSRGFDSKHIKTEMAIHKLKPVSPYKDIDLMLVAKREFNFLSNRMAYVAEQLGKDGKLETGGNSLWKKLRFSEGEELWEARRLMQQYNLRDILLTEELFYEMRGFISGVNLPVYGDLTRTGPLCPVCESADIQYRGLSRTSTRVYRRFQCNACGKWGRDAKSEGSVTSASL